MKGKSKPEKFLLRVVKGGFQPADGYTKQRLRDKGYHLDDVVLAQLSKPRNSKFHRLVHQFGALCAENIDDFTGLPAHTVLKRIQLEGNIYCEEIMVKIAGFGYTPVRLPRSLSYADMEEGEFEEYYKAVTRYVAENYWPDLNEEQIQRMAEMMPDT